jgi:hypothetical protein
MPADNHNQGDSTETAVARLQERLNNLEDLAKTTEAKTEALEKDRENALKWGIMLLGTAVISMATWIFNHFIAAKVFTP